MEWQLLEEKTSVESVNVSGVEVKAGTRVRLRPKAGGDIFDLALAGQVALVESIEQDYEGRNHLAVVLEVDPGRDLGMLRQPGAQGARAVVLERVQEALPRVARRLLLEVRQPLLVELLENVITHKKLVNRNSWRAMFSIYDSRFTSFTNLSPSK